MAQITLNSTGVASDGSLVLQSNGTTTALTVDASQNVSLTKNLTFTGTGNRITGDFSNATGGNRVSFQTSTANSNTIVQAIPNGTAFQTQFGLYTDSALTNGNFGDITLNNSEFRLRTLALGAGTAVPMTFSVAGSERARIDTSGNFLVGTTSATPSAPFTANLVAGTFRTMFTSGVVLNAASATLFTITVDTAYLVTIQTGNASGLSTTAIVKYASGGNPATATIIATDTANFTITISGTAVRVTNNLGGSVNYSHNSIRIH